MRNICFLSIIHPTRPYIQNCLQIIHTFVDIAHTLLLSLVMILLSLNLLHRVVVPNPSRKLLLITYPVLYSIVCMSSIDGTSKAKRSQKNQPKGKTYVALPASSLFALQASSFSMVDLTNGSFSFRDTLPLRSLRCSFSCRCRVLAES